ncbi:MAG: protein kinase domain-containing protein [Polyangiales bacterium]
MTPHGSHHGAGGFGPGTVVSGSYVIVRALSEGGMGAVYIAEHVTTRKQRALKVMHGELLGDQSLRDRFVQEAQIGGRIESEHVVEVVDAGFDEQLRVPWLAMELLDGEPLSARIERGPIPPSEVHDLFQQLCHALAAAHAVGIVHRDLKPENVFIARARRVGVPFTVKVLDFGIAKALQEAKQATRQATAAIGTPLWMAPEQTELGNRIAPASDVWALGLIAFRMLTSRYYWLEAYRNINNVGAILTEVLVKPLVPATQRAQELGCAHLIPQGFDAWFARTVDRDPNRRFPEAGQAFGALAAILRPTPTAIGTQVGWGSGGYTPAQMGTYVPQQQLPQHQPQQQSVSGTILGGPTPEMLSPQPPLVSPAYGVPQYSPQYSPQPPQVTPQQVPGTPPGVPMNTPAPRAKKKSSGAASFLIGLGSVLVLGGIAIVVIKATSDDKPKPENGTPAASAKSAQPDNKWVRIDAAKKSWILGIENDAMPPTVRGFRPARKMAAPFAAFEIQQHEVTWAEIEPWLSTQKGGKIPKEAPQEPAARAKLPATGLSWNQASSYCKSLGGNLPTEEQWELAARGTERRKYAWGSEGIDLRGTRAFAGSKATLVPVMTNEQDKTPGDDPLYDMMGNAQEWTIDVYQDDFPEQDESWTQSGNVSFRAVRGFPLAESADPSLMATMSAAYREPVCATGSCSPGGSSSGEPILLVRSAFSTPVPEAGAPARPLLSKTIAEAKSEMGTCLDKEDATRGLVVKVDYALPLKKFPICRASDGYDDPMECCTGKVCPHAPHRLLKYDPAKVTVNVPSEGWGSEAQAAGTCAKNALEKKLGTVKWPEAQDEWTATVWVLRIEPKPPKSLPWIGFRCVKTASGKSASGSKEK